MIGRKLGKYEITELLGQGGMAAVYRAYQADVERHVAVKVLPPHPGQAAQFVERFQLEAKTIARLQHPHILPLYDFGVEDDIFYLVMQFVEGGSLSERIKQGAMPPHEVEILLRQIASAVDYAHRQGVIHRDIKPENILLDSEGHALLADFGIVKLVGGDTNLTGTGAIVGTPAYMAPEIGQGDALTPQADIYSLGVVVYEMLTGEQPYTADTPIQVVLKHVQDPVPNILDSAVHLPRALEDVIYRVMAKEPQARYATALAFAEQFSRAIRDAGTLPASAAEAQATPHDDFGTRELPQPQTGPISSATLPSGETAVILKAGTTRWILAAGFVVIALLVAIVALLALNTVGDSADESPAGEPDAQPEQQTAPQTPTLVAANDVPPASDVPTFGQVTFTSDTHPGDRVNIRVNDLQPPDDDQVYVAWLLNTEDNSVLPVGEVFVDALGNGVTTYTDPEGRTLPALYNAVSITLEDEFTLTPAGPTVYSGRVPLELTTALREILVMSPNGLDGEDSLLASALAEADIGKSHANNAFNSADRGSVGGMHTHAEHVINIYLGTEDDYDGSGSGSNPGREYGVIRPLEFIEEQLVAVLNAPEATPSVERQIELIFPCIDNTRQRIDEVLAIHRELVVADDTAAMLPMAEAARDTAIEIIEGVDINENGNIEGLEDECGLRQIEQLGVLVGSIDIFEGALPS